MKITYETSSNLQTIAKWSQECIDRQIHNPYGEGLQIHVFRDATKFNTVMVNGKKFPYIKKMTIAKVRGKIIGWSTICYIYYVRVTAYVQPMYRRNGIGWRMVCLTRDKAKKLNIPYIFNRD